MPGPKLCLQTVLLVRSPPVRKIFLWVHGIGNQRCYFSNESWHPFENHSYVFLIGRAFYELGESDKALPYIEEAVRSDPAHADAYYYLGLLRDDGGDLRGAVEAFLRSRALDLAKPTASWAPSPDAFAQLVRRVITSLDALLARWVRDADVYIVDVPGAELVVDGVDPRAMVIVDARPADDTDLPGTTSALQARLFIYQRNVERGAGSVTALESELSGALEREITAVFLDRETPTTADKHHLNISQYIQSTHLSRHQHQPLL